MIITLVQLQQFCPWLFSHSKPCPRTEVRTEALRDGAVDRCVKCRKITLYRMGR